MSRDFEQEIENEIIRIEAEALARRRGLSADRVVRVFNNLHQVGWLRPEFPFCTALDEAMAFREPGEALGIFESMPLEELAERVALLDYLRLPDVPFLTLRELADLIDSFTHHLMSHQMHLIQTGYPEETFDQSLWLGSLLSRLYWLKLPLVEPLNQKIVCQGLRNTNIKSSSPPTTSLIHRNGKGSVEYRYRWALKPGNGYYVEELIQGLIRARGICWDGDLPYNDDGEPIEACSYVEAGYFDSFKREEIEAVERIRPVLFDVKVRVLKALAAALRNADANSAWRDSLDILVDRMSADECEFLLEFDERCAAIIPDNPIQLMMRLPSLKAVHCGGLKDILYLIGYCEKDISIGTMAKTRQDILEVMGTIPSSYYEVAGQLCQGQVDDSLDRFPDLERQERSFWRAYDGRVIAALDKEFMQDVVVSTRIKRSVAPQFEPLMKGFAEYAKAHMEAGGLPPSITIGSRKQPREEPSRIFRREGHFWTIRFEGKTIRLKDMKGLRYLAPLLANPGKEFPALDLEFVTGRSSSERAISDSQRWDEGLSLDSGVSSDPVSDAQALKEYKTKLGELEQEIDEAEKQGNTYRVEELKQVKERIEDTVRESLRPGGTRRLDNIPLERGRKRVSQNIVRAIDAIDEENPALGRHLNISISKGLVLMYNPDNPDIPWNT